jgi:uncharacterized membrane protein YcaP (DUF421 family)
MVDLAELFRWSQPPLETIIRGSAMYWFLFALFRFVLRRGAGQFALTDLLLLVLIADASQNGMAGEYRSISDGMLLVATIAGWNYLLDWLSFRFAVARRFVEPPPLPLVRDGRLLRANMRREMVTLDELQAQLREYGVEDVAQVRLAVLEGDGKLTVTRRDQAPAHAPHAASRLP